MNMKLCRLHDLKTVSDLISLSEYDSYISDKLGNDLFINDEERAARIAAAAENGADGSYHAEHLQDMRDFISDCLKIFDTEYDDIEEIEKYDITDIQEKALSAEIDEIELWHEKNGSLWHEIG